MRKIVHLSDLHFGTADPAVVEKVVEKVAEIDPHVVVISGDLTQRAKKIEFRQAREFLGRLPHPQIVVPGNHDVPLYNVFDRLLRGLDKYKAYITEDLSPEYVDEEIVIVGVNTARSLTIKGGRINSGQVDLVRSRFAKIGDNVIKIVVTHHPFDLPDGFDGRDMVGRADKVMSALSECGGEIFLAGHLHVGNIATTAKRYRLRDGHVALIVQAGTAVSARTRGEANSFNLITCDSPRLQIEKYECSKPKNGFVVVGTEAYQRNASGWHRSEGDSSGDMV